MRTITNVRQQTYVAPGQAQSPIPPAIAGSDAPKTPAAPAAPAAASYEPFATETMSTLLAVQERPPVIAGLDTQRVLEQLKSIGVQGNGSSARVPGDSDGMQSRFSDQLKPTLEENVARKETALARREGFLDWTHDRVDYLNDMLGKNPGNSCLMEDIASMKQRIVDETSAIAAQRADIAAFKKTYDPSGASDTNA